MEIKHIDKSFVHLFAEGPEDQQTLKKLKTILRTERDGWQFDYMVKIGRASKYDFHYKELDDNTLRIASGLLEIPAVAATLNIPVTADQPIDYSEAMKQMDLVIDTIDLPFYPYEYQITAAVRSIHHKRRLNIMCTGSGKSLTISLVLEYFRRNGLKGALIVPNINLLTQFANDIKSYNLDHLHSCIQKAGNGQKAQEFKEGKSLLITTWQSLKNVDHEFLKGLDYIICDEVHRFSSDCTSQLVLDSCNAEYKLGFTGTLPESKSKKMVILGLFGVPDPIITSAELIDQGRGTPIEIHAIKLIHDPIHCHYINQYKEYLDRLKYLQFIPQRTEIIRKLALNLKEKKLGGTLILYNLVDHGIDLYKAIAGEEPGFLADQKACGVFFMDGGTKAKDREEIRKLMDELPDAVLVANYALLSTGVNIKTLRYGIFASPLKAFTTIGQSLGRGIRLAENKEKFEIYDIVDDFPPVKTFVNSFGKRKKIYEHQKFNYDIRKIKLKA